MQSPIAGDSTPYLPVAHRSGQPMTAELFVTLKAELRHSSKALVRKHYQISQGTLRLVDRAKSWQHYKQLRAQKSGWRKGAKRNTVSVKAAPLPTKQPGLLRRLFGRKP